MNFPRCMFHYYHIFSCLSFISFAISDLSLRQLRRDGAKKENLHPPLHKFSDRFIYGYIRCPNLSFIHGYFCVAGYCKSSVFLDCRFVLFTIRAFLCSRILTMKNFEVVIWLSKLLCRLYRGCQRKLR
jgi:hypothetical protein